MSPLTKRILLEDALRYLERAVAALKEAGEPLTAMRVSAVKASLK